MALINHRTREIHFKIVYYGPGLCGKTTNLKALHDRLPPERRGRMISIATDNERTLFFDFLPIDLGQVNGFTTRFHLYTVPGQVYYKLSRRAVLQGVDGIIFVADSHPAREYANRDSLADLFEHLRTLGITGAVAARIPWVFQWNKRDAAHALPVERLAAVLNPHGAPAFEAVASDGRGVNETLRAACKAVLARLAASGEMHATPAPAMAAANAAAASAPPVRAVVPATMAPVQPAGARPAATAAAPKPAPPAPRPAPVPAAVGAAASAALVRVAPPVAPVAKPVAERPAAETVLPPAAITPPAPPRPAAPAPRAVPPAPLARPAAPPAASSHAPRVPSPPPLRAPIPRPAAPAAQQGTPPAVRRVPPAAPGQPTGPVRIVPRTIKPTQP